MKANPGGNIDPACVYGRDQIIAQIWDQLDRQCVLLNAERRIGKTSILRKMIAQPRQGWLPVLQDLEKVRTADEFAKTIYEMVQTHLPVWMKGLNLARQFYELHDFKSFQKKSQRPWKQLLETTVADLLREQRKQNQRLLFCWDEVPYMISNIAHSDGQLAAAEVLDLLRSLRQQHADLRMVLTGSIGLHHVLAEIRAANIPSEPVNDMFPIDVPPLARADAESLARDLIAGETLNCPDPNAAAACIAEESDCFPFYIHHIVNRLRLDQLSAVPASIQDVVARQLVDANDPWELSHYNDRLMVYYKNPQDVLLARAILDALSYDTDPVPVNSLLPVLNSATPIGDRDQVLRMLKLLERDHYLTRDRNGAYQFRFPLVRRWWALERGL